MTIKRIIIFKRMDDLMLTTESLAEAIGMSVKGMQGVLNSGTCSPITMGKLARVLGVEPWELVA